jgi:hypothetical protein
LIADAARSAAQAPASSGEHDRYDGLAAGFASAIRGIPLLRDGPPTGSEMRVAGLLTGNLQASLIRERGQVSSELMLRSAVYASMVAVWVSENGLPGKAEQLHAAHTAACIRLQRAGHAMGGGEERTFFGWLVGQAGVQVSPEMLERHERLRDRRLARHGG